MPKFKTTPCGGSSSCRPRNMATATFTGTKKEARQDWPDIECDASKSTGKAGDQPQQTEGGAKAPPKEIPPPPTDPQPGTSKDPTAAPAAVPTQDPTVAYPEEAEEETPPELTEYVKSYQQAGKTWLDMVLVQKEQAYITLYDRLSKIGEKHKDHLDQAVRDQVFASIKDKSGKCLSKDTFAMYVEQEDPPKKTKYRFTDDAKEALKDYYNTVDTLSQAQANFAQSTKVLEQKIEDRSVFLDIIKQMQLPAVQVSVRTIKEEEQLKNMTYREVTLHTHLPNFKKLNPNANEQTRTLAAFMYYVLYEQITGLQALQTGFATEFRCQTTPFKRLVTGKKQPVGPGRTLGTKSGRSLEEVAEMEAATCPKRSRATPKLAPPKPPRGRGRGKGKGRGKGNK